MNKIYISVDDKNNNKNNNEINNKKKYEENIKIKNNLEIQKNLTSYSADEIKYIWNSPIAKSILDNTPPLNRKKKSLQRLRDYYDDEQNYKNYLNDLRKKVKCLCCDKIVTRGSMYNHRKSFYCKKMQSMNQKLKDLIMK